MGRATFNSIPMIIQGDTTTHGGVVLEGDPAYVFNDIPTTGAGHKVYCPKCKGVFEIIEGPHSSFLPGRRPRAMEGHVTACGATLLAKPAGPAAMALALNPNKPASLTNTENDPFDQHFHLQDEATGQPLADCFYSITANGQTIHGRTDANGMTAKITSKEKFTAEINIYPEDDQNG